VEKETHPTHLETIVEWAVQKNKLRLALWGGDGSLNRTVQKLYEMDVLNRSQIALIPAGTCNDFAKKYYSSQFIKMAESALRDDVNVRDIDLGLVKANGTRRVFVNNAGFGREPQAIKGKRSNPISDILNFKEKKLQVECESDHIQHYETFRAFFGIFFNAPFFNCGMNFTKDVEIDDGLLDGFFVPPQSRLGLIWKFLKSRFGQQLKDRNTIHLKGKRIKIESDLELNPQVDGESLANHGIKNIEFSILKGMLKLEMPH
jgi:diacylglycerol kinase family enzyme